MGKDDGLWQRGAGNTRGVRPLRPSGPGGMIIRLQNIFNCQWSEYGSSFIDSFFVVSFLRIFFIVHDSAISLNAQLANLYFPSVWTIAGSGLLAEKQRTGCAGRNNEDMRHISRWGMKTIRSCHYSIRTAQFPNLPFSVKIKLFTELFYFFT